MGKIRLINKYIDKPEMDETVVDIMRGKPLGNPFHCNNSTRGASINAYRVWLRNKLSEPGRNPQKEAIFRIRELLADGYNVALKCCCAPKPCHGEIVIEEVNNL